jgi:glycosyltransferase involved in cell wall biosynthesis
MKVLVIIPAYNEENNILNVVSQLRNDYHQYDYVVVNDGSSDRTRKVCKDNDINMLDLPVNLGLAGAIKSGMKYANFYGYDYAVQIDGDGQHNPKYIEKMLECMETTRADIVIGSRFKTERKPLTMRMVGSQMITYAIRLTTGKYIGDVTSGMRLFNKSMIKKFGYEMNYSPEPDTLAYLLRCGYKIEEVQVEMSERDMGTSYLTVGKSVEYMLVRLVSIFIFQWVRVKPQKEEG